MSVTRIRYDERSFASAEQCLTEIATRLERGWTLSGLVDWHGRFRAIFSRTESRARDDSQTSGPPAGGAS